jgi:hypothetical protein
VILCALIFRHFFLAFFTPYFHGLSLSYDQRFHNALFEVAAFTFPTPHSFQFLNMQAVLGRVHVARFCKI